MTTAQELVEEVARRRHDEPVGNALLDAARSGRLTLDHLRRLVGTEAQTHRGEVPAYGVLLSRFPNRPAAGVYCAMAEIAYNAGPKLHVIAPALGMSPEDLRLWPPEQRTYNFNGILSWVAVQASQAAAALAAHSDMTVYFSDGDKLVAAIRESELDVPEEFLSYYAGDPTDDLKPMAVEAVQEGLDHGDDPHEAVFMARLLEEALGDFWSSPVTADA